MIRRVVPALVLAGLLFFSALVNVDAHAAPPPRHLYIVSLQDNAGDPAAIAVAQAGTPARVSRVYRHALHGYAASLTDAQVAALASDPRVQSIEPDLPIHAADLPSPQVLTKSVRRIGGDQSSTVSGNGTGSVDINVAVLDSGIDPTHPELNVAGSVDCTAKTYQPLGYHGTMVAGLIGARDNGVGIVGVAPGARLWSVRVLNQHDAGQNSFLLCGLDWITATRQDADPSNDIAVANMSLGGPQANPDNVCAPRNGDPIHRAVCRATAAGISLVAAAGNAGTDFGHSFPAAYPEVLAVTGTVEFDGIPGGLGVPTADCQATFAPGSPLVDDAPAFFSNYATAPSVRVHTVAAPSVCLTSTYPGNQLAFNSGTSFASPLVAGTVALCIATGPCAGLTPAQVITKIVLDDQAYNIHNPAYGFQGDPQHPVPGKYYGYLIRAGLY